MSRANRSLAAVTNDVQQTAQMAAQHSPRMLDMLVRSEVSVREIRGNELCQIWLTAQNGNDEYTYGTERGTDVAGRRGSQAVSSKLQWQPAFETGNCQSPGSTALLRHSFQLQGTGIDHESVIGVELYHGLKEARDRAAARISLDLPL